LVVVQTAPATPLAAPGPSPAVLSGHSFYLATELEKVEHHFDPDDWVDGEPMQITFEAPGKLALQYAQEDDTCGFIVANKRSPYVLTLSCVGKSISTARWIWLGPRRALTSLLSGGRTPELLREVVLPKEPLDLKALGARFDASYAAEQLPKLVGEYQDKKGMKLTIAPDGTATFAGESVKLTLKRCSADSPLPATAPCFERQPPEGEPQVGGQVFLAVKQAGHTVLEEGLYGSDVAYCPFESVPHTRKFARLGEEKASPPTR
jgi:hypothetical protein